MSIGSSNSPRTDLASAGLQMPDLSGLGSLLILSRMINLVFRSAAVRKHPDAPLVKHLVRLADKTTLEYEYARAELAKCRAKRAFGHFFRAVGHFENCVLTLNRALNFARRIRGRGLTHTDGTVLVPRGRDLELLSAATVKRVRQLRHAIEHIDEHVLNGSAPVGVPVAIQPMEDRIVLEEFEISYVDLARWVTQLHGLGARVGAA